ncbi:MAG: hypothetical protein AAB870_04515 [Patescibacteria group bacterium]|mgnify:CR=1 FL=1
MLKSWKALSQSAIGILLCGVLGIGALLFIFNRAILMGLVLMVTSKFIQFLMYALVFSLVIGLATMPFRGGGKK